MLISNKTSINQRLRHPNWYVRQHTYCELQED